MRVLTLSVLLSCIMLNNGPLTNAAGSATPLFNGKDLNGWKIVNGGQFSVENGVLRVNRGTGWLRSNETFSDFLLTMEFRFLEAEAASGIFIRTAPTSKNDENGWPDHGYQVQCMDTLTGNVPLAHLMPYGAPPFEDLSVSDLSDLTDMKALKRAYKPTGEWHTYEIKAEGENLWIHLNGVLVTTATNIKKLTGHIGIQAEGGLLEFRKIEVARM